MTFGLDVMATHAEYASGNPADTLSLMAVLRKDFALGQVGTGYIAAGIGSIRISSTTAGGIDVSDTVPGAQLAVGFRHNLGAWTSVFGELKHQVALRDGLDTDFASINQSYASTSLLVGLQFTPASASSSSPSTFDWSGELYGGGTLDRRERYGVGVVVSNEDIDRGRTLGFGIYADGVVPGLEVGMDVMTTRATYTGLELNIETLSLMAVLRKDFPIGQTMEAYVAGGLGAIRNSIASDNTKESDIVFGGQVVFGLRHSLPNATQVFGEVKYQAAFEDALFNVVPVQTQSYASTSVLLGVKFGF